MVRGTRIAAALGAVMILLAAGCGTASENPLAPESRSSRDSGGLGMGGNFTGDEGTTTTTTTSAPIAESDSTKRGGLGMGGN